MKTKKYNALSGVWDDNKKKFVAPGTIDWHWIGDESESLEDKLQRYSDAPDTFNNLAK